MAHARFRVRTSASSVVTAGKLMGPSPYRRVKLVSTRTNHASGKSTSRSTEISVLVLRGVMLSLKTPSG